MATEGASESQTILGRLESIPFSRFHVILLSLVFTAVAFDNMDQVTLSFVIPVYSKEWGLTPAITRIHPAMGIAGTLIGAVVGGIIADRIGRRKTFNSMILVFALTELANGFATSFAYVVAVCFVMGIGVGGSVSIGFSMISEFAPANKRGMMQILTGVVSIGAGYLIASGLAYAAMPILGWRFLFAVGVIPAFLVPLFLKYVPESPRYLIAQGRIGKAIESVRMVEKIAGVEHVPNLTVGPAAPPIDEKAGNPKELWKTKYRVRTTLIWAYGGLWGFFNFSMLIWLPTALKGSFGYSSTSAAFYTSIIDLIAIPIGFATAYLYEKAGRRPILAVYPVVGGIATILLGWFGSQGLLLPATLVVLGVLIYSTGFALAGMFPPYASELYDTKQRASGTGWGVAVSRFTGVVGLLAGGALLATGSGGLLFFAVAGVPAVVAGIAFVALGAETKRRSLEDIVGLGVPSLPQIGSHRGSREGELLKRIAAWRPKTWFRSED